MTAASRRRPLLFVFNHNPKAAGGSILDLLREFKPNEIVVKGHQGITPDLRQQLALLQQRQDDNFVVDSTLVHVREESCTKSQDRELGFVLGSVREPCSHYLSLWTFGSQGNGGFHHQHEQELGPLYGQEDPPFFNSTADVARFQQWLQHPIVHGYITKRFTHSYGAQLSGVDCLVVVENFHQTLLHCLQVYQARGGYVNWTAPLLAKVVEKANANDNNRLLEMESKNNALQSPQPFHHAPCHTYFSDSVARGIETGPDAFIYSLMGYQGCCSKVYDVTAIATRLDPSLPTSPLDQSDSKQAGLAPIICGGIVLVFLLSTMLLIVPRLVLAIQKTSRTTHQYNKTGECLDSVECVPLRSGSEGNDDDDDSNG